MELFQIRAGRVCILTCNTITVSQTPQLNAVNPSQTAVCRQEMPWVVQLISGSTFPFIQRHTHTHTYKYVLSPLAQMQDSAPGQVIIQLPASVVQVFFCIRASAGKIPFY